MRSLAPDLARGFMLLLIAAANSAWYLWGRAGTMSSLHPTDGSGLDRAVRAVLSVAVDGRIYPMFAFLFGYGMVQLARSRAARGIHPLEVRRELRRRHLFLLLFGLGHAVLLFAGDILGSYGLIGLALVALFFHRSDKVLLRWAGALTALIVLGGILATALGGWLLVAVASDPIAAEEMARIEYGEFSFEPAAQASYLWSVLERSVIWALVTPAVFLMFSIPAAILLGWWAARRGILENPGAHRALLTRVAVLGIGLGWLAGVPQALVHLDLWQLPEYAEWLVMPLAYAFGLFAGIGYAALFGLLTDRLSTPGRLTLALAAVGRRSLSFYLWQSLILAPLLSAWGLGIGQHVNTAGVVGIAAAVWLAGVGIAMWLDTRHRQGPAELLLRRLVSGGAAVPAAAAAAPGSR